MSEVEIFFSALLFIGLFIAMSIRKIPNKHSK